jgi:hypothetical protein
MSRLNTALAIFILFCVHASAQTSPRPLTDPASSRSPMTVLRDGTPVQLRVEKAISSSDARVGQSLELEVAEEVHVDNLIVISKGSAAYAKITAAQSKHTPERTGKLEISIEYLRLANGEKAPLRGLQIAGAADNLSASVLISPAPVHGKDVTVPKEMQVTAYVNGDLPLDSRKFQKLAGASDPHPTSYSPDELTELDFSSVPAAAEVSVDGDVVGVTPLRVMVPPGEHELAIRYAGYVAWLRTIKASGGKVTLAATLDRGENLNLRYKDGLSSSPPTDCTLKQCPSMPGATGANTPGGRTPQD